MPFVGVEKRRLKISVGWGKKDAFQPDDANLFKGRVEA
jgi:hypothetical protein